MQPWKLIQDTAILEGTPTSVGEILVRDSGFASTSHPKLKFNFTVDFSFRGLVLGANQMDLLDIPVKSASRPNQTISRTEVNYYNYRTKVATKVENGTGTITMYDDGDGKAHYIYDLYMSLLSPISTIGVNKQLIDNPSSVPFGQMSSVGPLGMNANGIFDTISVYHFYPKFFGDKCVVNRTEYRYINPQIESFELDELNMTENDTSTISLTFSYAGVTVLTTEV